MPNLHGCEKAAKDSPPGSGLLDGRFEHEHQTSVDRRLALHSERGSAALEEVLIGIVVPVLKPGDQMTGELALDGSSELVEVVVSRADGSSHHDR